MAAAMATAERLPGSGLELVRVSLAAEGGLPDTSIAYAPSLGCNLASFSVAGHEYLLGEERLDDAYRVLGTPILYPMPNRVREARFTFDGHRYAFAANNGPNFIHGLVRERAWETESPHHAPGSISVRARCAFAPGLPGFDLFPIRNTVELTYTVSAGSVRLEFAVHNEDGTRRLPYGLGVHPYWRIPGSRQDVRIQVPASGWMEAVDLLPTGRVLPPPQGPADLRQPTSLGALELDDVFCGMHEGTPMSAFYDDLGTRLRISASDAFTHCVVFTPDARSFFCLENQTCSTDAHNLHALGFGAAAHLSILDPGASASCWVQYTVSTA